MKRIVSLLLTLTVLICALFSGADVVRSETKDPYKESEKLLTVFQYDDKEPTLTREEFIKVHNYASNLYAFCGRKDKQYIMGRFVQQQFSSYESSYDNSINRTTYGKIAKAEFESKMGEVVALTDDNLKILRELYKFNGSTYSPFGPPGFGPPPPPPMEGYREIGNNRYEFYFATEYRENIYDVYNENTSFFLKQFFDKNNRIIYNGKEYWNDQMAFDGMGYTRLIGNKGYGTCVTVEYKDGKIRYVSDIHYVGRPEAYTKLPER